MKSTDADPILLTGATGLVGIHLAQDLLNQSKTLTIRGTWHHLEPFWHHERIQYHQADLLNSDQCRQAVQGMGSVVLAAGVTGGSHRLTTSPWQMIRDNLTITMNLLEACHQAKVKRVLFISSATTVYQEESGCLAETDLDLNQEPHPSYLGLGWAMRYLEKQCAFWQREMGLEVIVARLSNVYGPYAKFDPAHSNFVAALVRKAVAQQEPFEIWGNPEVARDLIYATDCAAALTHLLLAPEHPHQVYNVGSGTLVTVGQVTEHILRISGHQPHQRLYQSNRPQVSASRSLNCNRIKDLTGWKPRVSLEEGLAQTLAWWQENQSWWPK